LRGKRNVQQREILQGAMSQEDVDIVKRSFDAIAASDLDALLRLYDPAVEFLPLTGTRVESGGYRGHQGVRESGVVTDSPLAWVVTVRGGKITSHRGFRTADEALEAAELSD
jgi:ketosteroid isomerase-like protein